MNEPDLHMDHLADIWQKLSEIGSTKEFQGKVLAGLVVGLVLMILGFIFRIPQRIWRRINAQSIRVREIRRRRDPDLHSFLQVYESRIDAEYRVSSDDIIAWADHPQVGRIAGRKDFSLIAKKNGVCLAILKAMCIRKERLAFVAYLATRGRPSESSDGTDEAEGRKAIDALIGWLDRRLHRRGCKALVFEVSADDDGARVRLFRQYATLHNRKCLRIEMDYRQPKMDTGGGLGGEKKMSLVYVALRERGPDASLTLREVVEILHFVYFDIYGTTFAARYNEEERDVYTCYLEELLVQRVRSLSGRVHLSEI